MKANQLKVGKKWLRLVRVEEELVCQQVLPVEITLSPTEPRPYPVNIFNEHGPET